MIRRGSRRGYGLAFALFSLLGGVFLYLVAYRVAVAWGVSGWWGVAGWAGFVGVVSLVVRSEIAASAARQRRADEAWARYLATYGAAPQRRPRRRGRGGAR